MSGSACAGQPNTGAIPSRVVTDMDYQEALQKLERLRDGYTQFCLKPEPEETGLESLEEVIMLYGEVEEVINRFVGISEITVDPGTVHSTAYSNYIAATLLSGRSHYKHAGYTQLLKLIGKVRQHARDPAVPPGRVLSHRCDSGTAALQRMLSVSRLIS